MSDSARVPVERSTYQVQDLPGHDEGVEAVHELGYARRVVPLKGWSELLVGNIKEKGRTK